MFIIKKESQETDEYHPYTSYTDGLDKKLVPDDNKTTPLYAKYVSCEGEYVTIEARINAGVVTIIITSPGAKYQEEINSREFIKKLIIYHYDKDKIISVLKIEGTGRMQTIDLPVSTPISLHEMESQFIVSIGR